jgi:hypothetical protein
VLRAGWIQGESFVVSGVQTKLEPHLLTHLAHSKLSKIDLNLESYGPQSRGGEELNKTNH